MQNDKKTRKIPNLKINAVTARFNVAVKGVSLTLPSTFSNEHCDHCDSNGSDYKSRVILQNDKKKEDSKFSRSML